MFFPALNFNIPVYLLPLIVLVVRGLLGNGGGLKMVADDF